MNRWIGIGLIALVGLGLAVQSAANARLGAALRMPLAGALWNFVLGSLALAVVLSLIRGGWPSWQLFISAPRWSYVGGLLGAIFITATIVALPPTAMGRCVRGSMRCEKRWPAISKNRA